jgi:very-short-patch-repair endonuclease
MRHRISKGTLHLVLPSVLAVGHGALEPLAAETAALLYAGDDTALSHGTAAALWGLTAAAPPLVAITVIRRNIRPHEQLRVHRVQTLDARDVRIHQGFPVTAPARTIIDVTGSSGADAGHRALNEARVRKLVSDQELEAAIARCPGRMGTSRLRKILKAEKGRGFTRQEAERRLRALVTAAGLPPAEYNARLHGYELDALWRSAGIVVEVDGFAAHGQRAAFERDRRKDQVLAAAGYQVIRVTWRQIEHEPLAVVARIAQAMARSEGRLEVRAIDSQPQ